MTDSCALPKTDADLSPHARRILNLLLPMLDRRDEETATHSARVAGLAEELARELGLPDQEVERVRVAAWIHDLGKVAIPDPILRKPGALTDEECRVMRIHPVVGAEVAGALAECVEEACLVRHHHERFDGAGYPAGLAGDAIPLGARIIAVADAFDAMISDRIYRKAIPFPETMRRIREGRGTQFDPAVVDAFERLMASRRATQARALN